MMIDVFLRDWQHNKLRACFELIGMLFALGVSVLMAMTVPNPPMFYAYLGWLISAVLLCGCSWHRGSVGLTITYGGFLIIDGVGFCRLLGIF